MIVDGDGAILGRLASHVAQRLLTGETITIVNAEKTIITGRKHDIIEKYIARRQRGSPHHGPFFPKQPHLIVKRTVRGMLPKTARGRRALKSLRVHIGAHGDGAEKMKAKELVASHMTVGELAKILGWRP